jgi:hypothetical protein
MKILRTKSPKSNLSVLILLLLFLSCSKENIFNSNDLEYVAAKTTAETLENQLKKVKKAAMPFNSFEQAKKAGYVEDYPFNPSPYIPNMGFHYINVGLMDGTFEMEKPEILLYVPNEQGKLKLVGIEYAVPEALSETPPDGFIGESDHWEYNPNVAGGAWTLHAWVILDNPNGIFSPVNPNVPGSNPDEN